MNLLGHLRGTYMSTLFKMFKRVLTLKKYKDINRTLTLSKISRHILGTCFLDSNQTTRSFNSKRLIYSMTQNKIIYNSLIRVKN